MRYASGTFDHADLRRETAKAAFHQRFLPIDGAAAQRKLFTGPRKDCRNRPRGEATMKRLSLLLILLLVAAFVDPRLRARAEPHARPVIQWALNPVYVWSTSYRLAEIARGLSEHTARGNALPRAEDLSAYLRDYYRSEGADVDSWNGPFFLRTAGSETRVLSAGPDGIPDTNDDIRSAPLTAAVR
jgi:hypothetical protein